MKMNLKNYDVMDIGLIKLSVMFIALFLVSAWPGFAGFVTGTHWAIFLVIGIVLAIKPLVKTWK